MRSRSRDKQRVWFAKFKERQDGIDTIQEWSEPIMAKLTASTTSGTPDEIAAGVVPEYDRYLTYHKLPHGCCSLNLEEGMSVWVDVVPQLDDEGNLVMDEDGVTPVTPPDYTLKKILDSQKSIVARFGISKIGGSA